MFVKWFRCTPDIMHAIAIMLVRFFVLSHLEPLVATVPKQLVVILEDIVATLF